jgi:lipopolysaccharide export system permease protein
MRLFDRYVGRTVLRAFVIIAAGLAALFSLLVFVEQLALVGQGHYRSLDALAYAVLTAPNRLLQLAPVSMLLATLVGLGRLARGSELTAFLSSGVSEVRIIAAVMKLCVPVILVLFLLAQFVIPPAQLAAQRLQAAALGNALLGLSGGGFWVGRDRNFLNVQGFSGGDTLRGMSVYSFNPDGTLQTYLQAKRAQIRTHGPWVLSDVLSKHVQGGRIVTDHRTTLDWTPFLSSRQLRLLATPVGTMPPVALYNYVRQLKRLHEPAALFDQAFWDMVAIPLSLIGMVLIGAPFVFGSQRAGTAGRQIVIGSLLGIVFVLAQQITGYIGLLLDFSPAICALAPSVVLLGLSLWLLDRGEGGLGAA